MSTPRLLSALDLLKDRTKYDLDTKPERWVAGAPFQTLDIRPGRVILIGAPPAKGKTTLALQLVTDLLARQPALRCCVSNVETAAPVLLDKLLARFGSVDFAAVLNREFLDAERRRIDAAIEEYGDVLARLRFADPPYTVPALFNEMRDFDARLAVVDYVQRFSAGDKEDRQKLDAVCTQLRALADQGAAVVVVSSVSRQKNKRGSSTYSEGLSLAAFRGSGELEFGADSAFLLHCEPRTGVAKLECVKERFGLERDIPLRFCGAFQRFDAGDDLDGFDAAEPPGTVTT